VISIRLLFITFLFFILIKIIFILNKLSILYIKKIERFWTRFFVIPIIFLNIFFIIIYIVGLLKR